MPDIQIRTAVGENASTKHQEASHLDSPQNNDGVGDIKQNNE